MTLKKQEIKKHYQKVWPIIKKWGEDNGHLRIASNGPGSGWYDYVDGYDGNVRRPKILTRKRDYGNLVKTAMRGVRSIYATLNFLDPEKGFVQKKESSQVWKKKEDGDKVVEGNPLPEYEDIEFMTLFADVDLEGDYKPKRGEEKIKQTVIGAIQVYTNEFKKLAPNSINILDSGGGFYPFIHHDVTKPIGREFSGEVRGRIFDELTDRFNERLEKIWETVKSEVPKAEEFLAPDLLNNKNRLMKTPLSIHKKLDVVVHPIDPESPNFETEKAPATNGVIQETKKWLENLNAESKDVEVLIPELWPKYDGTWKERLQNWHKEDKQRREKLEEERKRQAERRKERLKELREGGKSLEDVKITNEIEDVFAAIDSIDVRDLAKPYITDQRDPPRFNPPWRVSESGTSCFATDSIFVDISEGNTGGGPVKFVARVEGLISSCKEKVEGEKWMRAVELLRKEYGYPIPKFDPKLIDQFSSEEETAIKMGEKIE